MTPTHPDANLNQHFANSVFSIDLRVYYEDTDAAGVVYYANYLRFMERARTEWLRAVARGSAEQLDVDALMHGSDGRRTGFVARQVDIRYDQPARLDDLIRVDAWVADSDADLGGRKAVGGASVWLKQTVRLLRSGTESRDSVPGDGTADGSEIKRPSGPDTKPLVQALVKLGCVDFESFKPTRLPPRLLEALR